MVQYTKQTQLQINKRGHRPFNNEWKTTSCLIFDKIENWLDYDGIDFHELKYESHHSIILPVPRLSVSKPNLPPTVHLRFKNEIRNSNKMSFECVFICAQQNVEITNKRRNRISIFWKYDLT